MDLIQGSIVVAIYRVVDSVMDFLGCHAIKNVVPKLIWLLDVPVKFTIRRILGAVRIVEITQFCAGNVNTHTAPH